MVRRPRHYIIIMFLRGGSVCVKVKGINPYRGPNVRIRLLIMHPARGECSCCWKEISLLITPDGGAGLKLHHVNLAALIERSRRLLLYIYAHTSEKRRLEYNIITQFAGDAKRNNFRELRNVQKKYRISGHSAKNKPSIGSSLFTRIWFNISAYNADLCD